MTDKVKEEELASTDSPTENETPEETTDEGVKEKSPAPTEVEKSEEEEAWGGLSGKSQERFKQILQEKKRLEEQTTRTAQQDLTQVQSQPQDFEVKQAVNRLVQEGVATRDDIYNVVGQMQNDQNHKRLADKYGGSKDLPKYDRTEVEDYAQRRGFGSNHEAAFQDMYRDEFIDHEVRLRSRKKRSVSGKPTASKKDKPLTLAQFRKELSTPEGYDKWMKDPKKFEETYKELTSEE